MAWAAKMAESGRGGMGVSRISEKLDEAIVKWRVCVVTVGHEAGYEVTVGHNVGFVGEVVANRVCVVTVGHEAGYEVTVGHGNGAMITRRPTMIVFMFVASNYICI